MRILLILVVIASVSGCSGFSESRMNPFNWFGSGESEEAASLPTDTTDPALDDGRPMVARVLSLAVDRTADGAIVTAIGQMPSSGFWGAELVPLNGGVPVRGEITYLFRVSEPEERSNSQNRVQRISVGVFLTIENLVGTRSIAVRGATNVMRTRR